MSSFNSNNQRFYSESFVGSVYRAVEAVRWVLIGAVVLSAAIGCKTLPKLDPSGESLCQNNQAGADRLSSSRENELASKLDDSSGCDQGVWAPTVASAAAKPDGRQSVEWSSQRPNGAVLFPKNVSGAGPQVVLEPRSIIAQVGSEVVMVASYIGPDRQRLRTGEKLEWNLDGAGRFLTGNPKNGCLYCDFTQTQKLDDQSFVTSTSSRLWRIHRGTTTTADDISILRGQSWATVQSYQEGTSTVSILAPNIDDWTQRTAGGQVHWIDAAFYYPNSGMTPIGEPATLTTSVFRKTTDEPRPGWIVRYEILSGPAAGFGPGFDQAVDVQTDAVGQAKVLFSQRDATAGANKIRVQVVRPSGDSLERVVVDEKTISWNWSGSAIFSIQTQTPSSGRAGGRQSYQLNVNNLSAMEQDAVVRMNVPAGVNIIASEPQVSVVANGVAAWVLERMPPRSTQAIRFDLDLPTAGTLNFNARVDQKTATSLIDSTTAPSSSISEPMDRPTPPSDPFGTASTPPAITNPKPADSAKIRFTTEFPAQAKSGEEFSTLLSVSRTGQNAGTTLSMVFPQGVYYLDKKTGARHSGTAAQPLVFASIRLDKDYPVYFISEKTGPQTIEMRVLDTDSGKTLDTATKSIEIVAAPAAASPSAASPSAASPSAAPSKQPQVDFKLNVQGENAPEFIMDREVTFVFTIKNNENYQISGLLLDCTPEYSRQGNPWTFVSSEPSEAAALPSGTYQLNLPPIPAGAEQKASITLKAQNQKVGGSLVTDLSMPDESSDKSIPLGQVKYAYSIHALQQAHRPTAQGEIITTDDRSDEPQKSETATAPSNAAPSNTAPSNTAPSNTAPSNAPRPAEQNAPVTPSPDEILDGGSQAN